MSQKRRRRNPVYLRKRLIYFIHAFDHAFKIHAVIDSTVCTTTETPTLTPPPCQIDHLVCRTKKSRICIILRAAPLPGTLKVHHITRRPS